MAIQAMIILQTRIAHRQNCGSKFLWMRKLPDKGEDSTFLGLKDIWLSGGALHIIHFDNRTAPILNMVNARTTV